MTVTELSLDDGHADNLSASIKLIPVFCRLPDGAVETLAAAAHERRVNAGETLFSAGQYESEDIFCCLSGRAWITQANAGDGSIIRRALGEGEVIGLDFVLAGQPERGAALSLQAETETVFLVIEADAVRDIVATSHQSTIVLLRETTRQLIGQETGEDIGQATVTARICRILCDMADRSADDTDWMIQSMPRHRELGALAGVSEKDAAEAVAQLIGMRIIKRHYPGMMVADYPALMAFAR